MYSGQFVRHCPLSASFLCDEGTISTLNGESVYMEMTGVLFQVTFENDQHVSFHHTIGITIILFLPDVQRWRLHMYVKPYGET